MARFISEMIGGVALIHMDITYPNTSTSETTEEIEAHKVVKSRKLRKSLWGGYDSSGRLVRISATVTPGNCGSAKFNQDLCSRLAEQMGREQLELMLSEYRILSTTVLNLFPQVAG